jgi:hypothetical protein
LAADPGGYSDPLPEYLLNEAAIRSAGAGAVCKGDGGDPGRLLCCVPAADILAAVHVVVLSRISNERVCHSAEKAFYVKERPKAGFARLSHCVVLQSENSSNQVGWLPSGGRTSARAGRYLGAFPERLLPREGGGFFRCLTGSTSGGIAFSNHLSRGRDGFGPVFRSSSRSRPSTKRAASSKLILRPIISASN